MSLPFYLSRLNIGVSFSGFSQVSFLDSFVFQEAPPAESYENNTARFRHLTVIRYAQGSHGILFNEGG